MLYNHPTPAYVMALQSMTLPPPPFTVIFTCLGFKLSPSRIQTQLLPSELNRFILVSSDRITLFQSSEVQCFRKLHQSKRFLMLALDSIGFLGLIIAPKPPLRSALRTVSGLTLVPTSVSSNFEILLALLTAFIVAWRTQNLSSAWESNLGRPPLSTFKLAHALFLLCPPQIYLHSKSPQLDAPIYLSLKE